jgi:hypothetical protein
VCSVASILRQFDTLTEFTLHDCEEHDGNDEYDFSVAVSEVFDALAGHSRLTKLSIKQEADEWQQYRKILMNGWESLTALPRKPSSNLIVLELKGTPMDDGGASLLAAGLLANASLKELSGWDTIFAALKRSACTLEMLSIGMHRRMHDGVSLSLLNALLDNCTLKLLSLCSSGNGYLRNATDARGSCSIITKSCMCVGKTRS